MKMCCCCCTRGNSKEPPINNNNSNSNILKNGLDRPIYYKRWSLNPPDQTVCRAIRGDNMCAGRQRERSFYRNWADSIPSQVLLLPISIVIVLRSGSVFNTIFVTIWWVLGGSALFFFPCVASAAQLVYAMRPQQQPLILLLAAECRLKITSFSTWRASFGRRGLVRAQSIKRWRLLLPNGLDPM